MTGPDLARFFTPRSIALIGASQRPTAPTNRLQRTLDAGGFTGELYPVNPQYDEVEGKKAYPTIRDLPVTPDLAIIGLAAARCAAALEEVAEVGVGNVVVISAGFSEVGQDELQRELAESAARLGINLMGPNTMGFANVAEGVYATFASPLSQRQTPGSVAFVSQSGGVAGLLSELAETAGIGKSIIAAVGNEAGLDLADVLTYVAGREDTTAVVIYVENLHRAERLLAAISDATAGGTRVITLVGGSSDTGARAARSHTGAVAQKPYVVYQLLADAGAIVTGSLLSTISTAQVVGGDRRTWPTLDHPVRTVILATSGGWGVLASDAASRQGLLLPELAPELRDELSGLLPSYVRPNNPVDLPPEVVTDPALLERIARIVSGRDDIDLVAVVGGQHIGAAGLTCAEGLAKGLAGSTRPAVAAWPSSDEAIRACFARVGVGVSESSDDVFHAARSLFRAPAPAIPGVSQKPATLQVDQPLVTEVELKGRLAALGISVPRLAIVTSRAEAWEASTKLVLPVAVKGVSPFLPHKAAVGVLRLGLETADDVANAYDEVAARLRELGVDGSVIVEEMSPAGAEVFIGISRDPVWGSLLVMGPGGGDVEGERGLQAARLERLAAEAVLERYLKRVADVVAGFPSVALPALKQVVLSLLEIWAAEDGWSELELNPVLVTADGVIVVDALAVPARPASPLPAYEGR